MRRLASLLSAALLSGATLWTAGLDAETPTIAVVANKESRVASLSRDELRQIFQTKTTRLPDGTRSDPVNLPQGNEVRTSFDRAVLGMDPNQVARYWVDRKIRGGNGPPKRLPSSLLVVKHVARTPGGLGYVPASAVTSEVTVVARVNGGQVTAP